MVCTLLKWLFGLPCAKYRMIRNETPIREDIGRFLSIVFGLERTNQLNLLLDKDLVDLCPPIEPYQVTKNQLKVKFKMIPIQAKPVKRPDVIAPHLAVDVVHNDGSRIRDPASINNLVVIRIRLLHGANYNDPPYFQSKSYQQIKSSGLRGSLLK